MPRRVTEWQEESSAVSGPLLVATGYHASWRGFFRDNFRRRRTYQWEGGEHGLDLVLGEAGREQPVVQPGIVFHRLRPAARLLLLLLLPRE